MDILPSVPSESPPPPPSRQGSSPRSSFREVFAPRDNQKPPEGCHGNPSRGAPQWFEHNTEQGDSQREITKRANRAWLFPRSTRAGSLRLRAPLTTESHGSRFQRASALPDLCPSFRESLRRPQGVLKETSETSDDSRSSGVDPMGSHVQEQRERDTPAQARDPAEPSTPHVRFVLGTRTSRGLVCRCYPKAARRACAA